MRTKPPANSPSEGRQYSMKTVTYVGPSQPPLMQPESGETRKSNKEEQRRQNRRVGQHTKRIQRLGKEKEEGNSG